MNRNILHKEVQDFITENHDKDLPSVVFKGSPFEEVSMQELAVQLTGKKKAKKKLPTWFEKEGIMYPPQLNLEQTSSEITAAYKASLTEGKLMADLTGGFGIDSFFFSKKFQQVFHCEINQNLSELVAHNKEVLGASNISCIAGDGMEFLENSSENFDWVYLDPSRRDDAGERVFHLSDCAPNVPESLDLLFSKAEKILLKTAPLLDLQAGIGQLKGVKAIHIVAVHNEVKELLWILEKGFSREIPVTAINFGKKEIQSFTSFFNERPAVSFEEPQAYLYEPNAAIMKSGQFESLGQQYDLSKLHQNTHLYTSGDLVEFPGRRFRILQKLPFNRKKIKRELQLKKANLSTRNFPESVENLRKQLKLKDGGDAYLFFTTTGKEERILLVCEKLD